MNVDRFVRIINAALDVDVGKTVDATREVLSDSVRALRMMAVAVGNASPHFSFCVLLMIPTCDVAELANQLPSHATHLVPTVNPAVALIFATASLDTWQAAFDQSPDLDFVRAQFNAIELCKK